LLEIIVFLPEPPGGDNAITDNVNFFNKTTLPGAQSFVLTKSIAA